MRLIDRFVDRFKSAYQSILMISIPKSTSLMIPPPSNFHPSLPLATPQQQQPNKKEKFYSTHDEFPKEKPPAPPTPPPILVVISPSSIHTPENLQSSLTPLLFPSGPPPSGNLKTPKCQSFPSEYVSAGIASTINFKSSPPTEW